MNKSIKIFILTIMLTLSIPISAKAYAVMDAQNLLDKALIQKTFYSYNMAYTAISQVEDANLQNELMIKLAGLQSVVWTEDIKKYLNLLNQLTQTGSGRIYDQIVSQIKTANMQDVDKDYLLGEVTGWGKRLVFTSDYSAAVDKVIAAWNHLNNRDKIDLNNVIFEAANAISNVINPESKSYLEEQLKEIKDKVEGIKTAESTLSKVVDIIWNNQKDREQKVVEFVQLTYKDNNIDFPKEYKSSAGVYYVIDHLGQKATPKSLEQFQNQVNSVIANCELSKFNIRETNPNEGSVFAKYKYAIWAVSVSENTTNENLDITNQVLELKTPLLEDTVINIQNANYIECKDSKLYLKPQMLISSVVDTPILEISYKGSSSNTPIILPVVIYSNNVNKMIEESSKFISSTQDKPLTLNRSWTDKMNAQGMMYELLRYEHGKLDKSILSAINLSQGKEILPDIKTPWLASVSRNITFKYKDYTNNKLDMKTPYWAWIDGAKHPEFNSHFFKYAVVYDNPSTEKYEVHFVEIGF